MAKSKIIINLDFNIININEYEIFSKAIIINCVHDNIKIKSKLFDGIIINSCEIKFKKEIEEKFIKLNIYNEFNKLLLYESTINSENNFDRVLNKLEEDKLHITNLIGNNGRINKMEIKNIIKRLDK